jgi:hypothetical protein
MFTLFEGGGLFDLNLCFIFNLDNLPTQINPKHTDYFETDPVTVAWISLIHDSRSAEVAAQRVASAFSVLIWNAFRITEFNVIIHSLIDETGTYILHFPPQLLVHLST